MAAEPELTKLSGLCNWFIGYKPKIPKEERRRPARPDDTEVDCREIGACHTIFDTYALLLWLTLCLYLDICPTKSGRYTREDQKILDQWSKFTDGLKTNKTLRRLTIAAHMSLPCRQLFIDALRVNTSLTELCLDFITLDTPYARFLVDLLENNSLTTLGIKCYRADGSAVNILVDALKNNKTLTTFHFFATVPSDTALLYSVLAVNTIITDFSVGIHGYTFVSDYPPISDAKVLSLPGGLHPNLKSLHLKYARITKLEFSSLMMMRSHPNLEELVLSYAGLNDAFAIFLANILRANQTLKRLSLDSNFIGDPGMKLLCGALRTNTTLTHLNLRINCISDTSIPDVAAVLENNSTLVHLDLDFNPITCDGTKRLAESLRKNTTITFMGYDVHRDLVELIGRNRSLVPGLQVAKSS